MPNPPRVSVVIPHFNSPESLARALRSIAAQTTGVHEVIVVDDASTSSTLREIRELIACDERWRLRELVENVGPATARNIGWDMAVGEVVAFLDADDVWHPRKIETQLKELLADDVILVAARQISMRGDSPRWPSGTTNSERLITKRQLLLRNCFPTSSVIVRRELSARFPYGHRYCEDYDLWLRISRLPGKCILLEDVLSARFKHAVGESGLSGNYRGMAKSEFRMFFRLTRNGALTRSDASIALATLTLRTARRFALLAVRRAASRLSPRGKGSSRR